MLGPGGNQSYFQIADGTFTYLAGYLGMSAAQTVPPMLIDNSAATSSFIGMEIDNMNLPNNIGAEVENEQSTTQAYFFGNATYHTTQAQWFARPGSGGLVSFDLNRAGASQYANQGDTTDGAVRSAWAQARALVWDTAQRAVGQGAIDLRVQHVSMNQTLGVTIDGQ